MGLFACIANGNTKNIHYAKAEQQTLDIYTPKTAKKEKHPVLIYIHGGGWTGGDKSNAASKPAFFTEKGYVFVSVNYRLHPDVQYDDMAYDVAKAVKWVEDHADEYQMDQSKINIMGHSAGGHLAGLIAADAKYLNSVGLKSASLNSIVILDGPLNLKQFIEAIPSYKKVFGPDEKVWTEASPLTYMNNQNLPPAYLVTRWADPSLYQFAAASNKAKGSDFVYQVKNLSHSGLNKMFGSPDAPQEAQDMTKAVMAFLEKKNKDVERKLVRSPAHALLPGRRLMVITAGFRHLLLHSQAIRYAQFQVDFIKQDAIVSIHHPIFQGLAMEACKTPSFQRRCFLLLSARIFFG